MSAPILRLGARDICKAIWCRCDLLYWDLLEMVPDEGIEPPTFGLQNRCTTAVLIRRAVSGATPLLSVHAKGPALSARYLRRKCRWRP